MSDGGFLADDPLARFLAEGGAIVAGATALGATGGYIAGSIGQTLGMNVDPMDWAERGGAVVGAFGFAYLILRAGEVG